MRSLVLLAVLCAVSRSHAVVIGSDGMDYPDGPVAGQSGGGFDHDFFDGESTGSPSDWSNVTAAPVIVNGRLETNDSSAKREYNGPLEGEGNPGDDGNNDHERSGALRATGKVFYRFRMTRSGNASWSGASSYQFGNERVFFGVPSGFHNGRREFGCEFGGAAGTYFSGIPADTEAHLIIAVLDFDDAFIGLWVDPDAGDFYQGGGDNSADAGGAYTPGAEYWSTAVRLGSGGHVVWDDLDVVTEWSDLGVIDPNDSDSDGMPDDWETANGLIVGTDDSGTDADLDGVANLQEHDLKLDPQERDSDGDGYDDGIELAAGSNPADAASFPGSVDAGGVVGVEDFDYPDGAIDGRNGGRHWDADNSDENDVFTGHTGTSSDWNWIGGNATVSGGVLLTQNGGAKREYNGPSEGVGDGSDERIGALSDDGRFHSHVIYYKFRMTRGPGTEWSGASSYDFGAERYLFGVPGAANPASGQREFAIHDLNQDQWAYSGIQPVTGQDYLLVAKLDFDNDEALLFLDPDLNAAESTQVPVASYPHTSGNWSSAIRLASGGNGTAAWDDVRVAHAWEGLRDDAPLAAADALTMPPGAAARIDVLANDTGTLDRGSVAITTPPAHGTATVQAGGTILYQHDGGAQATDGFGYEVSGPGAPAPSAAAVAITLAGSGRYDARHVALPAEPPSGLLELVDAFPGITFDSPHGFCTVPGDFGKLLVAEGDGRVFLIPDVTAPVKLEILDLTAEVAHDDNELALKGIAAHPDWATNGYIYLTYNSAAGTVRLSRFTCQTSAPFTAGDELILIEQDNDDAYHNIATCEFGPDGYLYVGFGDEGTQGDGHNNAQHVDRNLWSCIIRIDVDKKPGSLAPNPDPGADPDNDADLVIPRTGGEAHYAIPPDNPLIGATMFNGIAVNPGRVRTEIVVTGLRNPWQFSVEDDDNDGAVDALWVADVGRGDREEIDRFEIGDNGGWSWREGDIAGPRAGDALNGAPEAAATLTEPLWTYLRGGGPFQGNSVTGGFVYRGNALPQLAGKYIFADYVSGNIWSLEETGGGPVVERLAGETAIVGLLEDPATGEILLLDRGNVGGNQGTGSIRRLKLGADDQTLPATLSQVNFFSDTTTLAPNPGGHAYQPNLRFWSDHAEKSRWFLVPDAGDRFGFAQEDPWTLPAGTVWVKHFDYATEWETFPRNIDGGTVLDRRPVAGSPRRRIETRFLVRTATGAYGVSYRWNPINDGIQTDAVLVDDDGESVEIDITLDGAPGSVPWQIPSRANCMTCHTPEAGHALSFHTRQLNGDGQAGNQLTALAAAGYLDGFAGDPAQMPRHVRPDDEAYTLEERARSYLDVNCSYCHRAGGTGGGNWDARAWLALADTGMVNGLSVDAPLHAGDRLIVAEHAANSIIYSRMAEANGYSRMPPLATTVVDFEGAELLAAWINENIPPFSDYNDWRVARFGDDISPEGEPGANDDGDRFSNRFEWKLGGDPTRTDAPFTRVAVADPVTGVFHFSHSRLRAHELAGATFVYQASGDLTDWKAVEVTEVSALPSEDDPAYEIVTVEFPAGEIAGVEKVFVRVGTEP
ncbi:MAG: PQQ-dependent sugar dehydrogenase [Akkermansiaceae bacterium]|nr:PQQ-dependent sugar dehydrogenase [Akkermansiaceae bacterium]